MNLVKIITRFAISLIKTIIVTLICNILLAFFSGVDLNANSLIHFLNNNLTIFMIIFILSLILFYQRKRMTEKRELYTSKNDEAIPYGTSFFFYDNLLWEICIERSDFLYSHPPYFNYYVGRPLCPNPNEKKACLTPLIISDNIICYTEYCANCKKKYLRFKGYENDKYEIQTIIDSLILKNNIQNAEDLVKEIEKYVKKVLEENKEETH